MGINTFFQKLLADDKPAYADVELPQMIINDIKHEANKVALVDAALELFDPLHIVPIAYGLRALKTGYDKHGTLNKEEMTEIGVEAAVALALTGLSFYLTSSEHNEQQTSIYKQEYNRSEEPLTDPKELPDVFKNKIGEKLTSIAIISATITGAVTALARAGIFEHPGKEQLQNIIQAVDNNMPKVLNTGASPFIAATVAATVITLAAKPKFEQTAINKTNKIREKISHVKSLLADREADALQLPVLG